MLWIYGEAAYHDQNAWRDKNTQLWPKREKREEKAEVPVPL
jgi:hypothetical protein